MDIFWGVMVLLLVVGPTVAALAVRREDPARPWFPAGSDGAWPGGAAWDARGDRSVHGERWDRDAQRLDADLRAAASRPVEPGSVVDPHEVAAEVVLRRVVPNPAVRDGVRAAPAVPGGRPGRTRPPRRGGRGPGNAARALSPRVRSGAATRRSIACGVSGRTNGPDLVEVRAVRGGEGSALVRRASRPRRRPRRL